MQGCRGEGKYYQEAVTSSEKWDVDQGEGRQCKSPPSLGQKAVPPERSWGAVREAEVCLLGVQRGSVLLVTSNFEPH